MRNIVLVSVIMLLWLVSTACASDTGATTKIHGEEIILTTSDGLALHAWLTESPMGKAPLWVLLPMMGHTHQSYNPLIKALYERFKLKDSTWSLQVVPHILALDLRGHGASTRLKDGAISYQSMEPEDFKPYPSDVAAMIDKVLSGQELEIDRNNTVIIGASIGANTSVMAAEMVGRVSKVAMLSPGESYRSLEPAPALINFKGKVMIQTADEDSYSKTSCEKLAELNKGQCTVKIYKGPYHGTDLIDNEQQAMKDLLDWLIK